jgi:tripartite ATP-independent transporter DctP family solute receptor
MPTVSRRAVLSATGGLAAAAILRRPAQAAEFNYKLASVLPNDHPMTIRCIEAAAALKEQSGGRLAITVYPNSALGADTAMLSQCVSGAVEMYMLQGDLLAPRVPAAGILGVGFAFPNYDVVWPAIDGALGDFVRTQAEKSNMICLKRAYDHGFRQITSRNREIHSPADLKGFKIRLPVAPMPISMFKHMGASPTAINFSEVYSALQTGLVDGQENPLVIIDAAKLYEVEKYCSLTNHQWACYHVAFNMDAWKRLPQNLRDMTESVFDDAALKERKDWVTANQTLLETLKTKGLTFIQPDMAPFRAELSKTGFYPEVKARMGDQAWTLLEKFVGPLA